jgi:phosphoribosylformylglycinamidine cyclo-ligase
MSQSRYEQAGVSIDAQDRAIDNIKTAVASTRTPRVLSDLGSFGGLLDARFEDMEAPVLVASADGVGTKLKIAFDANRHDTVGQCLVNHSINDILVQGARPLFFMDYIATGKLHPDVVADVVKGMAVACKQSGLAILGGEMAEMPGFYQAGEYDVAGFIVGVVDRTKLLDGSRVKVGDKLIGLPSTGLHTNGYSLARKIVFEEQGLTLSDKIPGTNQTVEDALLAIHKPYYKVLADLLADDAIAAMSHITGGGFLDNIPRILPKDCNAAIDTQSYEVPGLFKFLVEKGEVSFEEAYRVFNMGIGMILIVEADRADSVTEHLKAQGEEPVALGEVVAGEGVVTLQ